MQFNVAQLLQSTVGTTRQYEIDEIVPSIDEYSTTEPVRGQAKLTRTNRGVYVEARLATTVKLPCSRCLEETLYPVAVRIREEYLPSVDVATGLPTESTEEGEEGEEFKIDEHHILDLDEAFRQYALLELPLQPLCRPDCAGLCPTCGANRNEGECGCPEEATDERVASLAKILREIENKE